MTCACCSRQATRLRGRQTVLRSLSLTRCAGASWLGGRDRAGLAAETAEPGGVSSPRAPMPLRRYAGVQQLRTTGGRLGIVCRYDVCQNCAIGRRDCDDPQRKRRQIGRECSRRATSRRIVLLRVRGSGVCREERVAVYWHLRELSSGAGGSACAAPAWAVVHEVSHLLECHRDGRLTFLADDCTQLWRTWRNSSIGLSLRTKDGGCEENG
jgi:hypothetical protein